jgi:hypothetical protein
LKQKGLLRITLWAQFPVTRSRIRQRVDRLRDLYKLEAALELSRAKPDINYLLQLELESTFLRDVAALIGEQI